MKRLGNLQQPVFFTPEGGAAYWVLNKTGGASIKGYVVEASSTTDNAVQYTSGDDIDPAGIVYDAGVADGGWIRVVFAGKAYVYYGTAVTRATFSRVPTVAEALPAGQAVAEALPTPPFATDKHFQEIGHPLESIAGPGLALTEIHKN